MIPWWWIPITAVIAGSFGMFMMAIIAGGARGEIQIGPGRKLQ